MNTSLKLTEADAEYLAEMIGDPDTTGFEAGCDERDLTHYLAHRLSPGERQSLEESVARDPAARERLERLAQQCALLLESGKLRDLNRSILKTIRKASSGASRGFPEISKALRSLFCSGTETELLFRTVPAAANSGSRFAGGTREIADPSHTAAIEFQEAKDGLRVILTSMVVDRGGVPIDEGVLVRFRCETTGWQAEDVFKREADDDDFVEASVRLPTGEEDFPPGSELIMTLHRDA